MRTHEVNFKVNLKRNEEKGSDNDKNPTRGTFNMTAAMEESRELGYGETSIGRSIWIRLFRVRYWRAAEIRRNSFGRRCANIFVQEPHRTLLRQ